MIKIIQSLNKRERLMLFAFILVCLLIWTSSLLKRWEGTGEVLREAQKTVKQQQVWLKNEPVFQAQLDQTMSQLDAEKMLNGNELTAFIDSYARDNKLKHELSSPIISRGKVSTRSTITVTYRNLSLQALVAFQLAVEAQRPYIAVEGLAVSANRSDPRLLNARITLSSLALNPTTAPQT